MRAIVQRVRSARVTVEGRVAGSCGAGLLLLVGVHRDDTEQEAHKLAQKIAHLRVFNDGEGKMNLSLLDFRTDSGELERSVLAVSNFTVYGDARKNRRPSFAESAPYEQGRALFDAFVASLRTTGIRVETGVFGAHMDVELLNDGPVTVIVDVP